MRFDDFDSPLPEISLRHFVGLSSRERPEDFKDEFAISEIGVALRFSEATEQVELARESAKTPKSLKKKLAGALAISPFSTEAFLQMAELATSPQEALTYIELGLRAFELLYGPEFMENMKGDFWTDEDTRPYIRGLFDSCLVLTDLRRNDEAIARAWRMIELCPSDQIGIRFWLANWLLEKRDHLGFQRLLKAFPEHADIAPWIYPQLLHALQTGAPTEKLFKKAFKKNPHVPRALLVMPFPDTMMPMSISIGSEEEAREYGYAGGYWAWRSTPEALESLLTAAKAEDLLG